jgi:hypothetical protein
VSSGPILLVIHQSPLRTVSEEEAIATLATAELGRSRMIEGLDTRPLKDDIEGGHWQSSHVYLHEQAARIRALADEAGITDIRYMGVAEAPHILALGAYVGDERLITVRDYDRNRNTWDWPSTQETLALKTVNLPMEEIPLTGDAVLRVEISYPILDADIDAVLGRDSRLADIRIMPANNGPTVGIVRSAADVTRVRLEVREALAALAAMRPNAQVIHLFVAAPVSVCLAIGQELRLRNGKDVQTYRYRSGTGDRVLTPAMLLTSGDVNDGRKALSLEEIRLAVKLRPIWQAALEDVQHHARALKASCADPNARWFSALQPAEALREAAPFPSLPPIHEVVQDKDSVAVAPFSGEFRLDAETRQWYFADDLLLGMFNAAGQEERRLREYARLFFWHEYVHLGQGLTSDTAVEIGRLANCLERVDYMADTYAVVHQLDFLARQQGTPVTDDETHRRVLRTQLDVALRSMWAFEEPPPLTVLQERRLRRYLNWYWRRVQLRDAPDLCSALEILGQQPCIEISGLRRRLAGGRVLVVVKDRGGFDRLHIGIVLENGRLKRRGSSADASIEGLLQAFSQHDTNAIERFFNALAEHTK